MTGQPTLLQIYVNESDLWVDAPLYQVVVRRLRELGLAGATASAGLMSFGPKHGVHERGAFGMHRDRPILISVVDEDDAIRRVLPELRRLVPRGLITLQRVEVVPPAE